jgi:GntR family transcriptional repressor for pyruvate dehydrogenase complex
MFENLPKCRGKLSLYVALDLYLGIRSGKRTINSWLPAENRLTAKYGVSRNTVREAIQILRLGGVVETNQGSGTQVISLVGNFPPGMFTEEIISKQQMLLDIYDFRRGLEMEFVAKAAVRRTSEDLEHMVRNLNVLEECVSEGTNIVDCGFGFHRKIAEASKSDIGLGMLLNLKAVVLQVMGRLAHIDGVDKTTLNLHRNLFSAIESGDPLRARSAMKADMDSAHDQLVWALDNDPELMKIGA